MNDNHILHLHGCEHLAANQLKAMFAEMCPERRVLLVDAENFTMELAKATLSKALDSLRTLYESLDVLIISNSQKLDSSQTAGKFFTEISNAMIAKGKWTVLISD